MKNTLAYYSRIYFMIISQDLKSKMSYRADFIISSIGIFAVNISGFVTFWLVFQNFPSIMGWTYYEVLFLYGFTLIAISPCQMFFDNLWPLSDHIRSGDFIKYCFRPINLFFYYMSEIFDVKGLSQFIFGIVMLAYAWNKLSIQMTPVGLLVLISSLVTSSLVMIGIMVFSSATGFWVVNSRSINMLAHRFKDYAKYPLTIFSGIFRIIFTFIIPIGFIAYYPSIYFIRPEEISIFTWISPFFSFIFFYLAFRFWMFGAMKYSGTGS